MFVVEKLIPKFNPLKLVVIIEPDATAFQLMVQCGKNDAEIHAVVYAVTTHQAGTSFAALSLETSPLI